MDLPSCLFDPGGHVSLGLCKPLGLGLADWSKLAGISLAAVTALIFRSILRPLVSLPIRALRLRRREHWPRISNETGHSNREMIGREGVLLRIREILLEGNPAAITNRRSGIAAVRGYGGVGKTFTSHNYLSKYRTQYEVVWVVAAETLDSIHVSLAQLGQALGSHEHKLESKAAAIQVLHQVSRLGNPTLIIYDNVISPRDIQPYLVGPGMVHYLITSRHDDWSGTAIDFPLGTLDLDAAIDLLRSETSRADADLARLAADLSGLPLALVTAGAYLRVNPDISIDDYKASLAERLRYAPTNVEYDKSIYASVVESYKRATPEGQTLANLCAFLAPDDIDPTLILRISSHIADENLAKIASDKNELSSIFAELRSIGLLGRTEQDQSAVHSVHRLTASVIRSFLTQDERYKFWATAFAKALMAIMPSGALFRPDLWPDYARFMPHAANLLDQGPPPTLEGRIAFIIVLMRSSDYLDARGDYETALTYVEACLGLSEEIFGRSSFEYLAALSHLSSLLVDLDRLDEAENYSRAALTTARQAQLSDDSIASALMNLARIYWKRSELEEAEPLIAESRDMTIRMTGEDSLATATANSNLGSLYSKLGRIDEAIELALASAATLKEHFGSKHPDIATSYINLAGYYAHKQQWTSAADYGMRALAVNMLLGLDDHPNTASIILSLKNIFSEAGMLSEFRLLQESLPALLEPTINKIEAEHNVFLATASRSNSHPYSSNWRARSDGLNQKSKSD
jgi:tetratricopeptide (TPR) repeat protein